MIQSKEEIVDVVNRNDEVIGTAPRSEVYTRGRSNRIVHIFVVDKSNGKILLQRRGANVRYLPNHYCTSAGGHVSAGEGYDEAARREMGEEIGVAGELHFVEKFVYDCPETNPPTPRFISLYIAFASEGFTLSEREVGEVLFVTPEECDRIIQAGIDVHPQLDPCYQAYKRSPFCNIYNS